MQHWLKQKNWSLNTSRITSRITERRRATRTTRTDGFYYLAIAVLIGYVTIFHLLNTLVELGVILSGFLRGLIVGGL